MSPNHQVGRHGSRANLCNDNNLPLLHSLSLHLCQNVIPLAAPDNEGDHGQREENRDEDEDGQHVIWWVHPDLLIIGAVGEKVLVYLDHVALYQRVGPVAVHVPGLLLCTVSELVVFPREEKEKAVINGQWPRLHV